MLNRMRFVKASTVLVVTVLCFNKSIKFANCKSLRRDGENNEEKDMKVAKATDSEIQSVTVQARAAAFKGGMFAASAGFIQVIALMWLRTTMNYQYRYGGTTTSAITELYKQGGVGRFYKGISYAIVLGPLAKFGAAAANEGSRVLMDSYKLNLATTQMCTTILGTLFTVLWKVFLMPLETCKTVLQVDGTRGFERLMARVYKGHFGALYQGSAAHVLVTITSNYPWFYVYNVLDGALEKSEKVVHIILRSAFIGFMASAVSDTVSNCLRIIKTVKQSTTSDGIKSLSYLQIVDTLYKEGGLHGIFGRGLMTRIITNGIQSIAFTVLWKMLPLLMEE